MLNKPNIIYILGDDHRADYLGCNKHKVLKTPNLDKLASDGILFKNAFCTSPLCTPSRVCHYLGQWERKHGVNFNSNSSVSCEAWENSFPMILKKNGYHIGWVGKNHVPAGNGGYKSGYFEEVFDYWYGNHGHSGFYPKDYSYGAMYKNAKADTQIEIFEEGVMNFLEPEKDFMKNAYHPLPERPAYKPFCLCVTFNLPHGQSTGTMQLRPEDDELYKSTYRDKQHLLEPPKTYIPYEKAYRNPRLPRYVYNGHYIPQYDYVKAPHTLKERQVRTCQTITGIDRFIGHLRDKLDILGIADNTVIIFSTDHGLHHGEHGIGGKSFLYEEDIRIPLIVYDPRNKTNGTVREEFALVPDLAPTVLDLAGFDIPETMQGTSLKPLLKNENTKWRTEFFTEQLMDIQNYPRSESIRTEDWKYIRYFKRTEDPSQADLPFRGTLDDYNECLNSILNTEMPIYEELYDLKNDPYEEYNLSKQKNYSEILDQLREKLIKHGKHIRPQKVQPLTCPLK